MCAAGFRPMVAAFLDYDSDKDADLLIGSLDGPDRLLKNGGSGKLELINDNYEYILHQTSGTLGIASVDLDGDRRLDVIQDQGEGEIPEKFHLGDEIPPDTASPVITLVEKIGSPEEDRPVQVRARVYDNKSPTTPHD